MAKASLGKGSLKLGVDGTGLDSGLDKSQNKLDKYGTKLQKKVGFWKKTLQGGMSVASGVLAAGVVTKGYDMIYGRVEGLEEKIKSSKIEFPEDVEKGINGSLTAFDQISQVIDDVTGRMLAALAPAITVVADKFIEWSPTIFPIIETLGSWLEQIIEIGIATYEVFAESVSGIVDSIIDWVNEVFGLEDSWMSFSDLFRVIMGVVAQVGGAAWDILKAGAGVVVIAAGGIITVIGEVIGAFGELIKLAKHLPEDLQPSWLTDFTDAIDHASESVKNFGIAGLETGVDMIESFGQTGDFLEDKVEKIARKAQAKKEKVAKELAEIGRIERDNKNKSGGTTAELKTILAGSKEDISLRAKFYNESIGVKGGKDKTLEENKKQTNELKEIKRAIKENKLVVGQV